MKLRAALLYILGNAGDMEIMRLAKFLYLADYMYAKTFGNTTGFIGEHQRYKYGPVPASFYDEYNKLLTEEIIDRKGNIISLEKEISATDDLEEEELACLDKVISDFEGKSLNDVKAFAYSTEPMKDIQEEESRLGVPGVLEFTKMDFKNVEVHPLLKPMDIDLSFLDSADFKKNLG